MPIREYYELFRLISFYCDVGERNSARADGEPPGNMRAGITKPKTTFIHGRIDAGPDQIFS
jgi:hypothetical protein